jgi:biopolymer transport protein ExbD
MKVNILLFLFLLTGVCFSQTEKINLPNGYEFEIKYRKKNITKIYDIFITKKGSLSIQENKLSLEKLGNLLFNENIKLSEENKDIKILLYADVETEYCFIDAVKSQISSSKINSIYYRTNNIEDLSKGLGLRNQASLTYKKVPTVKNNDEITINIDDIIQKHPIQKLQDELYSQQFSKATFSLKKLKYKKVKFINGKKIKIGNKRIKLSDSEKIFNEIKDLDFYFIKSKSKLKYGHYFKNISTIIKLYRSKKVDIPFIEVSLELQKKLEEAKFKL